MDNFGERVRKYRRHLHEHPELSHNEFETANFIEAELRTMRACEVFRPAPTSVCALFGSHGPVTAIRADIDGLAIAETGDCSYRSRNPGVMHACGHDGHTAALLGVAASLSERREEGYPHVKAILLIFQQAEESTPSGAPLVLEGLPEDISLESAFGFHLWPELPVGTIGLIEGPLMAAVDGLVLHVECDERGPQHGTQAESTSADAISIILDVYHQLQPRMRRRALNHDQPSTLHFGRIEGGERPNNVARKAALHGTLRSINPEAREDTLRELNALLESTSVRGGSGVRVWVDKHLNIRPHLVNDGQAVVKLATAARANKCNVVRYPERPLGISEDFGWYLTRCPGAFMLVGCTPPGSEVRNLHAANFDFDETALLISATTLMTLACADS